jgi:hypothetical protein
VPAPSDELVAKCLSGGLVRQEHRALVALDAQDWAGIHLGRVRYLG